MAKYFILFGLILSIIGAVAGYVAGAWIPVPIGILGGGILLLIVGLILLSWGFWRRRSTQTGINAFVATIALMTMIVSLNLVANNYGRTLDLTENNRYTLAPQSQKLVANLEKPLKVFVFEHPPSSKNKRLLENYQRYSPNFEFEFVDPQKDMSKVKSFGVESSGETYIQYGDKTQFVQKVNESQPLSEVELTNAINLMQRDRASFAYFLQGHGEPPLEEVQGGFSQAVASLENQGYQVQPFNFAEETNLPSSANRVLIIVSPQQNLFPGEIEAIQNFVAEGGHLFFLLDRESSDSLKPLLKPWGIELDDRIIVDASGRGQALGFNAATVFVTRYGDHPITNPLGNGISVYPLSRPVDARDISAVEATPLAYSHEESWAESNLSAEQLEYNPQRDRAGPLVLGFALERTKKTDKEIVPPSERIKPSEDSVDEKTEREILPPRERSQPSLETPKPTTGEATTEEEDFGENTSRDQQNSPQNIDTASPEPSIDSRVVIFGNSEFAKNGLFPRQLNGDIFLNSVDWLVSQEDDASLGIRLKEETNRRINLTTQQADILRNVAMLVVPLFGVILAIISWLRRR